MKKNSFKIIGRRVLSIVMVSALISFNPAAAQIKAAANFQSSPAVVKYVGSINDAYVFNVAYSNENGDKFLLSILDGSGDTLFAGTYNEKKFDKRFRLLKEGNEKLSFVIKNLKDNSIQTFEIKTSTEIVQDVVVRKISG